MLLWDPAGQEQYNCVTKSYFNHLDALILVFDLTSPESFASVLRWYRRIRDMKDCPVLILGNKIDLDDDICITDSEMQEVSDMCGISCVQASGLAGIEVENAFFSIIAQAYDTKLKY